MAPQAPMRFRRAVSGAKVVSAFVAFEGKEVNIVTGVAMRANIKYTPMRVVTDGSHDEMV